MFVDLSSHAGRIRSLRIAEMNAQASLSAARREAGLAVSAFFLALDYLSFPNGKKDDEPWCHFVSVHALAQAHASAAFWAERAATLEVAGFIPVGSSS